MTQPLIVIGAGGFGRETLDVIEAINAVAPTFDLLGVIDAHPSEVALQRLHARGVTFLGTDEAIILERDAQFVAAIGSPSVRETVTARLVAAGAQPATLVHPAAVIGSVPRIGRGSVVCAGAQVSTNVSIGEYVHINPNATIGHDAVLEDFVSINPGGIVSGEVFVESGALVGAGAVILQGLRVGRGSTVGAAACVVRDVAPTATVKGIPAR
ncbi:acetyltransferase [Salinibacterium sp. SYSU T00001]|uniref:acetyltransferase n=1 Tax=Homoserinimonas sedimenticola TaxID=2986805 RepID=UPI0022366340|nr:acetyltransferase [Salinibacterium sedimenticola]MCW4385032.1 acetyltransferase [Salinibacterium sedimenticola]